MDIDLYFEQAGQGPPLVLLHGNGEDGTYFARQMEYFSGAYPGYRRGHEGARELPAGNRAVYNRVGQFSEDLNRFFERQALQKAILLGFSDGANIAMRFALKHQGKLSALILNGGNLNTSGIKRRAHPH